MPVKIVSNDITKMKVPAIVNLASSQVEVRNGSEFAVYTAAGYETLLAYRRQNIGVVSEGQSFLTPAYNLPATYIIHTVCPPYFYKNKEEEKLRSCYQSSFTVAAQQGITELAVPLIETDGLEYAKEEGIRIAMDEIHAFLQSHEMTVFLVVPDSQQKDLKNQMISDLNCYIDDHYIFHKRQKYNTLNKTIKKKPYVKIEDNCYELTYLDLETPFLDFEEEHESKLQERMKHCSDSFSTYLLYLIQQKNMENKEVYKRAIVDKKTFSKIKNHPEYHPQKRTALCLCIGAKLNLDESKDLLARAGYALSPCDKTDIIFSYFIEHELYDMIELDIQLEEHGLPCIIS